MPLFLFITLHIHRKENQTSNNFCCPIWHETIAVFIRLVLFHINLSVLLLLPLPLCNLVVHLNFLMFRFTFHTVTEFCVFFRWSCWWSRCALLFFSLSYICTWSSQNEDLNKNESDFFTRQQFSAGKKSNIISCIYVCVCMYVNIICMYIMVYKNSKQESTKVGKFLVTFSFHCPTLALFLFLSSAFFSYTFSNLFYPPKSQQTINFHPKLCRPLSVRSYFRSI